MKKVTIEFRCQITFIIYDETKGKALLNAVWDGLKSLGVQDISRIIDDSKKKFIVEYADGFNEPVLLLGNRKINHIK